MIHTLGKYRYKDGKIYKQVWWCFYREIYKMPYVHAAKGAAIVCLLEEERPLYSYKGIPSRIEQELIQNAIRS